MRLDIYLTETELASSRSKAAVLIKNGAVRVNGAVVTKSSLDVTDTAVVEITKPLRYVGRGGYKLETLVNSCQLRFDGLICVDIGASTGGFTDCLLQHGAAKVYAVDVGHGQLDKTLKADTRVISLENTDIRGLLLPQLCDFAVCDLSFISLTKVIADIKPLIKTGGRLAALIKPQFEVGRVKLKHGVLKDERVITKVVNETAAFTEAQGFKRLALIKSAITGGDGNTEYISLYENLP
ncbi:MAG: TlyA family RNA methyltransferase [Oscillospiraceae bacterium]|jgi:23S rRNA (cytidine1920-2'-O)/16S rRNA (cytidine1409-2'-O)-methyltransferase|nr:TlyA family RNA methyltransferase [Oscillospiraceae bacterium]